MKTRIALTCALLTAVIQVSLAATSITLDPGSVLTVADAQGAQVASLDSGSISQKISADNQTFKLSFGQDLQGRHTVIIYPDPESPQSLDLNIMGQTVQMTQDSVLTITANADGSSSQFQAGVLGEITLAGSPISPGSSLTVQNGQMIATTPVELLNDNEAEAIIKREELAAAMQNQPVVDSYSNTLAEFNQGMIVKQVTGTVMMAEDGENVLDVLRGSAEMPTLKEGDIIPVGATLRTDFGSELVIAQSPGVTFQVLPNSNIKFTENEYKVENGVEKRTFKAKLDKGGIISNLDGVDPSNTDYQIKTPLAVAAARGTSFSVYTSSSITVVVTASGTVEVIGSDGAVYTATIGEKAIVTFDPASANPNDTKTAEFEATPAELQTIAALVKASALLNAANKVSNATGGNNAAVERFKEIADQAVQDAVENFQATIDARLNPGAITPTTSGE